MRHKLFRVIVLILLLAGHAFAEQKGYRLVYFGTDDAPACKKFRPELIKFEKATGVPVAYVDVKYKTSEMYKDYIYLYSGDHIPLTVLISPQRRPLKKWVGYIDPDKFKKEVVSAMR